MGRRVLLAVAGGEGAFEGTVFWAMRHVILPDDTLHIASVMPGPIPDTPFTRALGDYSSVASGVWDMERAAAEAAANETLQQILAIVQNPVFQFRGTIKSALLRPAAGASYYGAAIVKYAELREVHLAILGNRKIKGILKRKLAAIRGEASTSEFCARHLKCPCVVVPEGVTPGGHQPAVLVESVGEERTHVAVPVLKGRLPMKLCIEVNSFQPQSLAWALKNVARDPWDEIHVVAVYMPIVVQANGYMPDKVTARKATRRAAAVLSELGVPAAFIHRAELPDTSEESNDRVRTVCSYIEKNGIQTMVVPSNLKSRLTRFLHSTLPTAATHVEKCLMNAPCPVMVHREVTW
mmetsp:Transcript_21516/g.38325  ORF Transcript_21516/g.38325 Transcript_21516/m.38325 type:complete len:351 (-) Transcript_21516:293-1345(-)